MGMIIAPYCKSLATNQCSGGRMDFVFFVSHMSSGVMSRIGRSEGSRTSDAREVSKTQTFMYTRGYTMPMRPYSAILCLLQANVYIVDI